MRAIDRMAAIFADPDMPFSFVVMACGEVLVPAEEVVKIARRLAAEEKSGDEAPTPKEAPAELLAELESLAGEDNAYYMHINGQKKTDVSYVCRKSLQEIISRYRPAPSRTEKPEIVCPACDFEGEAVKVCPSCGTPEKGKASFAGIAPDRTADLGKWLKE